MTLDSYFIKIAGKNSHFITKGEGPTIILLHASPLSGASMIPFANELSQHFRVICPDTPGYGQSEGPETQPIDIVHYAEWLNQFTNQLGIDNCAIYGSATGAQIGIRYSLMYPDKVSYLFLDNSAHFTDSERSRIMREYFPDFSPKEDGSHLSKIWDTVNNLFIYFPWCFQEPEYKLSSPLPPPFVLDSITLDYIVSGSSYDWAYRVAFEHEIRTHVENLKVDTLIFRWDGSILRPYIDRLFVNELAQNITSQVVSKDQDRFSQMTEGIKKHYLPKAYNSTVVNISEAKTNDQKAKSDPKLLDRLPSFPKHKSDGSHWLKAWQEISEFLDDKNLKTHSRLLIDWANKSKS